MENSVRQKLLALNRQFYQTVADEFHRTRLGWTPGLLRILQHIPPGTKQRPTRVLDVGCGNGRYAQVLDERGTPTEYTGVDGNARLLALAVQNTADLVHTKTRFLQANLADPDWWAVLASESFRFDVVMCLATMHHLPSYSLRLRVLQDFCTLSQKSVILSFWQFLSSERLAAKCLDWTTVGLSPDDVEPGDALMPWKAGREAVRYVHQVDVTELQRLADDAGLSIVETFRADGKEGNLNLYAILDVR